eukprot:g18833.t1
MDAGSFRERWDVDFFQGFLPDLQRILLFAQLTEDAESTLPSCTSLAPWVSLTRRFAPLALRPSAHAVELQRSLEEIPTGTLLQLQGRLMMLFRTDTAADERFGEPKATISLHEHQRFHGRCALPRPEVSWRYLVDVFGSVSDGEVAALLVAAEIEHVPLPRLLAQAARQAVAQGQEAMLLRWAMDGAEPVCVRVAIYDASGLKATVDEVSISSHHRWARGRSSSVGTLVKVASWSCAAATACWWAPRPATLGTDRVAGGGSERVERVLKMMVLISAELQRQKEEEERVRLEAKVQERKQRVEEFLKSNHRFLHFLALADLSTTAEAQRTWRRARSGGGDPRDGPPHGSVYFLHLLCFTMSGPLLPVLRKHFHLAAAKTGLLTSAFPFGMLFALMLFPGLSDRYGRVSAMRRSRKPILMICFSGLTCGFLLQAKALLSNWSFETFLKLRAFSGAFAGCAAVLKAFLADVYTGRALLPEAMAFREAAGTAAYIVGPSLGGLLICFADAKAIPLAGAVLSILAILLLLAVPERRGQAQRPRPSPSADEATARREKRRRGAGRLLSVVILVHGLYALGQSVFEAFFGVWCAESFGFSPARVGQVLTSLALLVFLTHTFLYSRLVSRLGIMNVGVLGRKAAKAKAKAKAEPNGDEPKDEKEEVEPAPKAKRARTKKSAMEEIEAKKKKTGNTEEEAAASPSPKRKLFQSEDEGEGEGEKTVPAAKATAKAKAAPKRKRAKKIEEKADDEVIEEEPEPKAEAKAAPKKRGRGKGKKAAEEAPDATVTPTKKGSGKGRGRKKASPKVKMSPARKEAIDRKKAEAAEARAARRRRAQELENLEATEFADEQKQGIIRHALKKSKGLTFENLKLFLYANFPVNTDKAELSPYWTRTASGVKTRLIPAKPQVAYFAFSTGDWNGRMVASYVASALLVP